MKVESQAATAASLISKRASLAKLREVAAGCQACPLWKTGTQTVFGEGSSKAAYVLVGEQPGHEEDLAGKPFVGPAGRLLNKAMEEAGIALEDVYVTNVVKHFKWVLQGKRRLHKKPGAREIAACKPWLEAEVDRVQPRLVVCLGATAAQALLGKEFRVSVDRGQVMERDELNFLATIHPSAVLRAGGGMDREKMLAGLVADLRVAREAVEG